MELNSARLEGSSRIQERPFENPAEQRRQRPPRKQREDPAPVGDENLTDEERESHEIDDLV